MRWFALLSQLKGESLLELSKDDYHYLSRVKRLQQGGALSIVFNESEQWDVDVIGFSPEGLLFNCTQKVKVDLRDKWQFHVAQSLPKQDKFSDVIDMCTQVNVKSFTPVHTSRCIVNYTDKQAEKKMQRWEKVSHSASLQSQRVQASYIRPILGFSDFINQDFSDYVLKLVAWEEESSVSLKEGVEAVEGLSGSIFIFIGPEGGLSASEVTLLKEKGFISVSLGVSILRTEYAAFFTIAQLSSLLV